MAQLGGAGMTTVITRFPISDADNPTIWRVLEGQWQNLGHLSDYIADVADDNVMALVPAADARCIWTSLPDLELRQAEGVAKLRATEHSLGLVHASARAVADDVVVTATIAAKVMQSGLDRLALRGFNPDIVIPLGLAIDSAPEHIFKADFDGLTVLRGERFAMPDEAVFRDLFIGTSEVREIGIAEVRAMLLATSESPLLNLREGTFAKRERHVWATASQRRWIMRLLIALVTATVLLGLVTLAKYWSATSAENGRALTAAQKIDPAIQDIEQAEAQLDRTLQQKGLAKGRFAPLSAGLWRAVQAAPNVSARELRYGNDGILTVVLAAPDAGSINKALLAVQQDGFRITATPRQDSSGATLVDLTMRMP
jgi:general secretion pathway protein L